MIHFIFNDIDPRYLFLKFDNDEDDKHLRELQSYMNLISPICFVPNYKGPTFTEDFLYEYVQSSGQKIYYCAIGLWQDIYMFLKERGYAFDGLLENKERFKNKIQHTFEEFKDIVMDWGLSIPPRPYQFEAAYKILQYKQSVSQLATRAGKTLIAYMIFRYAMEYMGVKKILMIVPSIDLVKQGYSDFEKYAEFFNTECVWSQGKLVQSSNLTIGTFQSLIKFLERCDAKRQPNKKYNPSFFDGFDMVFVDETHRATANQIKTIISQPFMKTNIISFGMTGTLPKKHTVEHYCLHALLGAKIQEITPRELMDNGYISDIFINQIRLNYFNDIDLQKIYIDCAEYALSDYVMMPSKKDPSKKEKVKLDNPQFLKQYVKELPIGISDAKNQLIEDNKYNKEEFYIKYIGFLKKIIKASTSATNLNIEQMTKHFLDKRINYLCDDILPKCDKNTLILAHYTEYIRYFSDIIKKKFPNRHVYVITGNVTSKKRDEIKKLLSEHNDCILCASYGVMSTGITLPNLCFGVLFESFKSNIVNMQSLGRGLGLSEYKDKYIVYDIVDGFDPNLFSNKLYLQGLEHIKIYKENKYPFKIINKRL